MAFIGLLAVLFIGQLVLNEGFYIGATDASGSSDASGSTITLSISDLLALLGSSSTRAAASTTSVPADMSVNALYTREIRDNIKQDIKTAVKSELLNSSLLNNSNDTMDDSCVDSISSQQGADFMKYIPGKNPDDYIRKDSIPCYGCNLPTN